MKNLSIGDWPSAVMICLFVFRTLGTVLWTQHFLQKLSTFEKFNKMKLLSIFALCARAAIQVPGISLGVSYSQRNWNQIRRIWKYFKMVSVNWISSNVAKMVHTIWTHQRSIRLGKWKKSLSQTAHGVRQFNVAKEMILRSYS